MLAGVHPAKPSYEQTGRRGPSVVKKGRKRLLAFGRTSVRTAARPMPILDSAIVLVQPRRTISKYQNASRRAIAKSVARRSFDGKDTASSARLRSRLKKRSRNGGARRTTRAG